MILSAVSWLRSVRQKITTQINKLFDSGKSFDESNTIAITEAEKIEAERIEAERLEAERIEAERIEAERTEAERTEAERTEAERTEAERIEAERIEAERIEAERVEAERVEAERVEAERVEAERVEAERVEAESSVANNAEIENTEVEPTDGDSTDVECNKTDSTELERMTSEDTKTEDIKAENMTQNVETSDGANNSNLTDKELMRVLEAALFSAGQTLKIERLMDLFPDDKQPGKDAIQDALNALQEQYLENTSLELKEVSSGFRFQVREDYASWVAKLFEERPARYSRATLETLALIAYRQPITRAEIEEVRGVSVSSQIIKTMIERDWIRVIGHRDVPGKPALYSTTKGFLDYFNLKSLTELPALADLRDIDAINAELDLQVPTVPSVPTADSVEQGESNDAEITELEQASISEDRNNNEELDKTSEIIH